MTTLAELETTAQDLLTELHRATEGRIETQASMYAIGEAIGLTREASAAAAEELMAHGLVEIRILSGAIGFSAQGLDLLADEGNADNMSRRLGLDSPLNTAQSDLVEQVLTTIKSGLGQSGLPFDMLSEVVADIRTIEAQLASPKPKTLIIRECFASLEHAAREGRQEAWRKVIEELLA